MRLGLLLGELDLRSLESGNVTMGTCVSEGGKLAGLPEQQRGEGASEGEAAITARAHGGRGYVVPPQGPGHHEGPC